MSGITSIGKASPLLDDLALHGYVRLSQRLGLMEIGTLRTLFEDMVDSGRAGSRVGEIGETGDVAVRILDVLREAGIFQEPVMSILGQGAVLTRTLFFRKSAEVNWPVGWHQDVTVMTRTGRDIPPGFGPASHKDGQSHVTAPEQFLAGLLSARIHLDDADRDSGALEIIPGSHRRGRIPHRNIAAQLADDVPAYVPAEAGEIHLFRPLLLHRSGKMAGDGMRRVIQLEMSPVDSLPGALEWNRCVPVL